MKTNSFAFPFVPASCCTAAIALAFAGCTTSPVSVEPPTREAVVFVGAHPDDTEGYAATAFLLRKKYDVYVVDLTRGELGLGMPGYKDGSTAKRRMAEEAEACKVLGAKHVFLSEIDGFACAGEKSVDQLAALLKEVKPKAVFTHWPVDAHVDHVQTAAVTANALRRSGVETERYFFEVLRSQTCNYVPRYYVDVTETIFDKAKMLRCYDCQNARDLLVQEKLDQAEWRGRQLKPAVRAAETFTTYDGKPIRGGVLEGLAETHDVLAGEADGASRP